MNDEFFEPGDGVHVEFAAGTVEPSRGHYEDHVMRPPFLEACILSCYIGQQDDGITVIKL
jgi:hypothetical protein